MMKLLAYLIESAFYILLITICTPYAYIAFDLGHYGLAFANTGVVLFMMAMYIIATVDFIKSLKGKSKGKGRRFK